MSIGTTIVVFGCVWWIIFFITLPFGVTVSDTPEKGHASSAPEKPRLVLKAVIATVIALSITIAFSYFLQITA